MDTAQLKEFATKYTAAWCSQNAASVEAFFAERGSLKINVTLSDVVREAIDKPESDAGAYHTMAGFVRARLGRIPREGDQFEWRRL